jgi:adenylate cyclase
VTDDRAILDAVDALLLPGKARYTRAELAERAGVDPGEIRRFWRAMGFPDVPDDDPVFTDTDVAVIAAFARFLQDDMVDPEVALQITRVVGQAMSRVAEAQIAAVRERLEALGEIEDRTDEQIGTAIVERSATLLPAIEQLLLYQWRRHLAAAAQRTLMARRAEGADGTRLTIGFADMVGFTVLSQQLRERELADVVERFETVAYDTVASHGGRIVKMIGDEVMFVTDDPAAAAEIGLVLAEVYGEDEMVSDVRVGLAHGVAIAVEGDYFGPTVNLASRIVNIAYVGAVVVSGDVRAALEPDPRFVLKPVRPRRLKGIGITPLWVVRRPDRGARPIPEAVRERMRARRGA